MGEEKGETLLRRCEEGGMVWRPREGWLGQGLEQVCVLMGKDQQGGPVRRLMTEERGGNMRIQVP